MCDTELIEQQAEIIKKQADIIVKLRNRLAQFEALEAETWLTTSPVSKQK